MICRSPCILVTDAGRGSGLAVIRSLGRRGWRVIAADRDPASPGFRSRYTERSLVYPPPMSRPQEYLQTLWEAADREGVDLIVPVTEASILPLTQARGMFEGRCRLALPDQAAWEVTANKQQTIELAQSLGIPAPKTRTVSSADEAKRCAHEFAWPLVIKPQRSQLYHSDGSSEPLKVSYAQDAEELVQEVARYEGRCAVLLQEYVAGAGCGVELLLSEGEPLAAFQHKRLREIPVHGGASAYRESVPLDPLLYDYSLRLMRALRWTGLAMVEFKLGDAGPKLMEINGRIWGSLPLAVASGVDFPARLVELYLGDGAAASNQLTANVPQLSYRVGVRARNLRLDLLWMGAVLLQRNRHAFLPMPRRRQALAAMLGLFNPAAKIDSFTLNDPRPGLAELRGILRKLRSSFAAVE